MRKLVMLVVFVMAMTGVAMASEPVGPEPGNVSWSVGRQEAPSAAAEGRAIAADETIVLTGKVVRFRVVDLGRKGESVGDILIIREALLDETGERVGSQVYRCTLHFKPDLQCDGSNVLDGRGQISFVNIVDTSGGTPPPATITGGSGEFANVGGQMLIEFQGEDNVYTLEILRLS